MTLDNDEMSYNLNGLVSEEGSTIVLGRSTITNNSNYGIFNTGTIDTFQNNQIYANGNNNAVGGSTPLTPVSTQ
jgi:ABC-type branched-subunit amino acid transport system ATPase component